MNTSTSISKSPLTFFLLVFIIALPFWLIGAMTDKVLPKEIQMNLPISALAAFCPMIAALILTYRESGSGGVNRLLKRSFDHRRIKGKIWYVPIFFLMPVMMVLEYVLLKLMGVPIPDFQFPVLMIPVFFMAFFIFSMGEEIGWSGYAIDPLHDQWGALRASIILGVVWAVWHLIPFIQTHNTLIWVAAQDAGAVMLRVLIVWLYYNTGKSVFAAITFHVMVNLSELTLFPIYGSYYDPVITFVIMAIMVGIVVFLWGPRTLARYRYA